MAKGDVVEMKIGETIYPFEKFGSDLYASGSVRSLGFSAHRIAKYRDGVWYPIERAQQSVHWTAIAVSGLAFIANFVIGWFVFRCITRRQ